MPTPPDPTPCHPAVMKKAVPRPRAALRDLKPEPHGAITPGEMERLGLHPSAVLDFSANINPYGPSPSVRDALTHIPIARYPDPDALALRRVLARHLSQSMENILVGNGVSELIWLVVLAFVEPGDRAMVVEPTYGEYARALRLMAATIVRWRATPDDHFAIHPDAIASRLNHERPRVVFLCHPNNPTGQLLPLDALATWADAHPATLFVVDEAYLPFAPGAESALALNRANILVLRSMTKAQALAGLRLGFAVGPAPLIHALRQVQPPWSVNAAAQAAGVAALADPAWLRASLARLQKDAQALVQALRARGWAPHPSATHFFLLPVEDASTMRAQLLRRGIVVRDATSFGLPTHIRIAARTAADNARLLHALP